MSRFFRIACLVTLFCFVWGLAAPASGSSGERERAPAPTTDSCARASAPAQGACNPGFQETPGERKVAKKFPWLLVGAGAAVVVTAVLLLTGKKSGSDNGGNNGSIEYGTVTDIDGNVYRTVKIGTQWWMTENLRTTRYSDGTPLESFVYEDNDANLEGYGRMYRWTATMRLPAGSDSIPGRVQGASPSGWHIPSAAEWQELINSLGGEAVAGGKLKEAGTVHWSSPNTGATNETGFSAVPSGYRDFGTVGFYNMGTRCLMAVAIGYNGWPTARELKHNSAAIIGAGMHPDDAISVRCVRD